jgi:hypothetical protein
MQSKIKSNRVASIFTRSSLFYLIIVILFFIIIFVVIIIDFNSASDTVEDKIGDNKRVDKVSSAITESNTIKTAKETDLELTDEQKEDISLSTEESVDSVKKNLGSVGFISGLYETKQTNSSTIAVFKLDKQSSERDKLESIKLLRSNKVTMLKNLLAIGDIPRGPSLSLVFFYLNIDLPLCTSTRPIPIPNLLSIEDVPQSSNALAIDVTDNSSVLSTNNVIDIPQSSNALAEADNSSVLSTNDTNESVDGTTLVPVSGLSMPIIIQHVDNMYEDILALRYMIVQYILRNPTIVPNSEGIDSNIPNLTIVPNSEGIDSSIPTTPKIRKCYKASLKTRLTDSTRSNTITDSTRSTPQTRKTYLASPRKIEFKSNSNRLEQLNTRTTSPSSSSSSSSARSIIQRAPIQIVKYVLVKVSGVAPIVLDSSIPLSFTVSASQLFMSSFPKSFSYVTPSLVYYFSSVSSYTPIEYL